MSTDSDTPTVDVPPPPLAAEDEPTQPRLHWATGTLTMAAGVGACCVALVPMQVMSWQGAAGGSPFAGLSALGGKATTTLAAGLGAVLADRLGRSPWPRPMRWAVGMGLAAGVGYIGWHLPSLALATHMPPATREALGLAVMHMAPYAWVGLWLGCAALSDPTPRWRLALTGMATLLVAWAIIVGLLTPVPGGAGALPPRYWQGLILSGVSAAVEGGLIGAAFAVGLALGRRQQKGASPS